MKAMILAAGLGTRLKPFTLKHPKALVPVGGVAMLQRVVDKLQQQGFKEIVINVHHFASQIVDYVSKMENVVNGDVDIKISDESDLLLDTGGGLVKAYKSGLLGKSRVLVHNVDILSDADLADLWKRSEIERSAATLLVSDRKSSRKLIFDNRGELRGWENKLTGEVKPLGFERMTDDVERAFSGIYVVDYKAIEEMADLYGDKPFSVTDYFLNPKRTQKISSYDCKSLHLIDIGKPETLAAANLDLSLQG